MANRIFFLFPPQVHLLDIIGPVHLFYEARELGADLRLHFINFTGEQEIVSSAGLNISRLEHYDQYVLDANDWIILPGLEKQLIDTLDSSDQLAPFFTWLRAQNDTGTKICSICTGAYLLAGSGLLRHKQCTTHWKYLDDFSRKFPEVEVLKDRLFVKDRNLFSSAGVTSGIDLSLFIIEEVFGAMLAAKIAKEVVLYMRRAENDPQLSIFLQYRNHIENRIHQVQDLLAQHLNQGMKIEDLAGSVCMSPRNLTRLFKKTTGITIGKYQDKLRVERAVSLLEAGQKVENVALACGFSGANQLRELLKNQVGLLPSDFLPLR